MKCIKTVIRVYSNGTIGRFCTQLTWVLIASTTYDHPFPLKMIPELRARSKSWAPIGMTSYFKKNNVKTT